MIKPGAFKKLNKLTFLRRTFAFIAQAGVDASRNLRNRAAVDALRRRFDNLHKPCLDVAAPLFDNFGADIFAGPGAGNKHDAPVAQTSEPVAAVNVFGYIYR
jgi:hypothetical protein